MSGIYIPSMELPDKNHVVLLELNNDGKAFAAYDGGRTRIAEFDAIPVPDHGRLIDADALEHDFEKLLHQDNWYYNSLHHAPTIIQADEGDGE